MSRWYDVTVLTQTRNRPGIEKELAKGLPEDRTLRFEYFQFPGVIYRLKSRFDLLTWPYYFFWQIAISRIARRLHRQRPFAIAHHVTFVSFRVPVWLKTLGVPVVFGPVGGAEQAPRHLLKQGFGPDIWCKELVRNMATAIWARCIRFLPPLASRRGICLAATPGMAEIFASVSLPTEVFPAVGVDAADPDPVARALASTEIRFLFVGRLHPLKGVYLLLRAFAQAAIPNASLTVIGGGADEGRLQQLAASLGIADKVVWQGSLPRAELPAAYRQHDVLVAPSLYESGGLVVLEAMSQGLPAIVLDVGGHSVSVTDACGTKVSASGSVDQVVVRLSDAMKRYAGNPALVALHGKAARQRVESEYQWPRKARRMRHIYEQLLA